MAIVEESHREHLKVAVHALDTTSIQTAIDAGADSIEHGNSATVRVCRAKRRRVREMQAVKHLGREKLRQAAYRKKVLV